MPDDARDILFGRTVPQDEARASVEDYVRRRDRARAAHDKALAELNARFKPLPAGAPGPNRRERRRQRKSR